MTEKIWIDEYEDSPLIATAIHAGHEIRGELLPLIALDDAERTREEDPYTDYFVKVVPTWLVATHSRFEVDLNRDREDAVYTSPEMAWGLHLWKQPPDDGMLERSREEYDAFYAELKLLLDRLTRHFERIVVFDIHAYNFRRDGSTAPPADQQTHPDVNVGTGTMDRARYGHIVDRFIKDLSNYDFPGRRLDVRENVKFEGRRLAQWIHSNYPDNCCVLSVEFKKFYMDEWTGVCDVEQTQALRDALQSTVPGILQELDKLKGSSNE